MTTESIIAKIQKLLALAGNNPSANEAAAAAAMAQKLMLEHKLSMSAVEMSASAGEPIVEYDVLADEGGRSPRQWKVNLLGAICNNNFCRSVYWSARFHVGENKHLNRGHMSRGKMVIFGKRSDIDTVLYLYQWLVNEVERLAKKAKQQIKDEHGPNSYKEEVSIRSWTDSFRKGCVTTISTKMYLQRKHQEESIRNSVACTALVKVEQETKRVDKYVEDHYKIGAPRSMPLADRDGYSAGQTAASSIDLSGGKGRLGSPAKQIGNK
jgi:hypothetical protein